MKKVFTSIWFLSAVIAIPIIIFMPSLFQKYIIEEVSRRPHQKLFKNSQVYFADLNGDTNKEAIEIGELVIDSKERIVVEFAEHSPMIVFKGEGYKPGKLLYFEDTNNDSYNEIFGFSFSGDSLFLNVAQPYAENRRFPLPEAESYSVPFLYPQDGRKKWTGVDEGHFFDIDDDGFNEFIYSVKYYGDFSGKSIFIFDNQTKSFRQSEIIGDRNMNLHWCDIDGDGSFELIADGNGAGAAGKELLLSDGNPYLKVYDSDLTFKLQPVKFPKGRIKTITLKEDNETFFYTIWQEAHKRLEYGLYKINSSGELLDSIKFMAKNPVIFPWIEKTPNGDIILCGENEEIVVYTSDLNLKKHITLNVDGEDLFLLKKNDFNEDGVDEFLCMTYKSRRFFIFSDEFKERIEVGKELKMIPDSKIKIAAGQFYLQDEDFAYIFQFKKNPYRYLEYPVCLGIYLLVLVLVFIIRKTQEGRLKEKFELKNKIRDLQLNALKNQLDPHFVYNTFNTIASVVKKGKAEEGYNMIVQFSKLVRNNIDDSLKTETTLRKEIEFVKDYMELQRIRFKDKLEYSINIDENVDLSVMVPKLIMQIHVENALKHGFHNCKEKGIILIDINKQKDGIQIEIEDNGIGREEAKRQSIDSTGLGLKTIQQIIDLSNQKRKNRISQYLSDLKDEHGEARGTNVVVNITV